MKGEVFLFRNKCISLIFEPDGEAGFGWNTSRIKEARVTIDSVLVERCQQEGGFPADDILVSKLNAVLGTVDVEGLAVIRELGVLFTPLDKDSLRVQVYGMQWIQEAIQELGYRYTLHFEISETETRDSGCSIRSESPITGEGMCGPCVQHFPGGNSAVVYMEDLKFPVAWKEVWGHPHNSLTGKISLKVVTSNILSGEAKGEGSAEMDIIGMSPADPLGVNKKLLEEGIATDLVIISDGGVAHRCHKAFLIAHSRVFEKMFENEWKEAADSTVTMDDISRDGLDAVLAYLYYSGSEKLSKNLKFAQEVLLFAHKYEMERLEIGVTKLILLQSPGWFPADRTLQLYLYAKNCEMPLREPLEKKLVEMMKSKLDEVVALPDFKALNQQAPDSFYDLSVALLLSKEQQSRGGQCR